MKRSAALLLLFCCTLSAGAYPRRYYRDSHGHWVKRPRLYKRGPRTPPAAICRDGSYTFTTSHHGACSHHGGVRKWER